MGVGSLYSFYNNHIEKKRDTFLELNKTNIPLVK